MFARTALVRVAGACALLAACSNDLEPLPLDLTVQASRTTAAPGDTVVFVATIQGQNLLGLEADYGDGTVESQAAAGARTGKMTFRHAYGARGSYTTRITVTDAPDIQKSASIGIQVF